MPHTLGVGADGTCRISGSYRDRYRTRSPSGSYGARSETRTGCTDPPTSTEYDPVEAYSRDVVPAGSATEPRPTLAPSFAPQAALVTCPTGRPSRSSSSPPHSIGSG